MKELVLDAVLGNVDTVIDFVCAELESNNVADEMQNQIAIAADEVFANIANYAYAGSCAAGAPQTGTARVCIEISGGELQIIFEDSGKPYNPLLDSQDPDLTLPISERSIGGLGVFMVKKIMDAVQYRYQDGKNQLTLIKAIA